MDVSKEMTHIIEVVLSRRITIANLLQSYDGYHDDQDRMTAKAKQFTPKLQETLCVIGFR